MLDTQFLQGNLAPNNLVGNKKSPQSHGMDARSVFKSYQPTKTFGQGCNNFTPNVWRNHSHFEGADASNGLRVIHQTSMDICIYISIYIYMYMRHT